MRRTRILITLTTVSVFALPVADAFARSSWSSAFGLAAKFWGFGI